MEKNTTHILRISLAITFIWIGVLIFREPEVWGGYLQPWAINLLPVSVGQAMIGAALFDMAVGCFLLVNIYVYLFAFLAAIHLIVILITSGVTDITVRDIGLLGASLTLFFNDWINFKNCLKRFLLI